MQKKQSRIDNELLSIKPNKLNAHLNENDSISDIIVDSKIDINHENAHTGWFAGYNPFEHASYLYVRI